MNDILRGIKYYFLNYILCWLPSYKIRYFFYKRIYKMNISDICAIHIGTKFYGHGKKLNIGDNTTINPECRIDCREGCDIGKNVSISREVFILTLGHDYNDKKFSLKGSKVTIENDVWIGIRAMIMPGVKLGKGCVVAANSVVTRDVEPYTVVAGSPAKKVAMRKEQDYDSILYKPFLGGGQT